MRFRLRYRQRELDLSEGSLTVGRSSSCQLFLDDPLVSRRHAIFLVAGSGVTVEDLQSRNGVLVNGRRIQARTMLRPGDHVLIGSAELTLTATPSEVSKALDESVGRRTLSRLPAPSPVPVATAAPHTQGVVGSNEADASTVRRANAFNLLSAVAEKALALGRAEEAERLLAGPLGELIEASRSGQRLSASLVDTVARLAVRVAAATGKGTWVDSTIELYRAQARPCPGPVIDELNTAARRVNAIDGALLRAYLSVLHGKQASFGPADRFLLQRLEGLERLVGLR
jgi:predicted component of type VI protein secretion system